MSVIFTIEIGQEIDDRWLAEVVELPGVVAYGSTSDEAVTRAQALALRVGADRLEHDEAGGLPHHFLQRGVIVTQWPSTHARLALAAAHVDAHCQVEWVAA